MPKKNNPPGWGSSRDMWRDPKTVNSKTGGRFGDWLDNCLGVVVMTVVVAGALVVGTVKLFG